MKATIKTLGAVALLAMSCSNSTDSQNEPEPQYPTEPSSSSLYVAPSSSSERTPEPQSSSSQYVAPTPSSSSVPTQQPSSSSKQTSKTIDDYIDEYCELEAQCFTDDTCREQITRYMNLPQNVNKQEEAIKRHIANIQNVIDNDCNVGF